MESELMNYVDLLSFIEANVEVRESGCWHWGKGGSPYPSVKIGGKSVRLSRLSYEVYKGPIPEGHYACHHCDNPECLNPDHLFAGTAKDNSKDMVQKGRHRRGSRSNIRRTKQILLRLSMDEWVLWKKIADVFHLRLSEWIRNTMNREAAKERKERDW